MRRGRRMGGLFPKRWLTRSLTRPLLERPSGRHDAQNPVESTECHNGKRYIHADTPLNWSVSYKRFRLVHGRRNDDENVERSHQTRESESITGWYRSIRSYQSTGRVDDYSVRNEVALTKPSDCVCSHGKARESAGAHRCITTGRLGWFNRRDSWWSRLRSEKMPAACEVRR